jgi:hypothetical protein
MAARVDVLKNPAVTAAAGAVSLIAGGVAATYGAAARLPLIGAQIRRGVAVLSAHGERAIDASVQQIRMTISDTAAEMVDKILAELDLQAIIREAPDSVTAEVMTDVCAEAHRAENYVSEIVDEVFGRTSKDH